MRIFDKTYPDRQQYKRTNNAVLMLLLYMSIIIFFIPLVIKLLQVKKIPGGVIPPQLNLGTLILIGSSWILYQSRSFIKKDDIRKLRFSLLAALMMGLVFLYLQFEGWKQIYYASVASEIKIIIVMILVHAVHFFASVLMLLVLLISLWKVRSRAEAYIYFLDAKHSTAFRAHYSYWDFLGVLWLLLYAIMLCKSL